MSERPYGEILDDMDHQAKYQPATVEPQERSSETMIRLAIAALEDTNGTRERRIQNALRFLRTAILLP